MDRLYNYKDGYAGLGYFIENQIESYVEDDEDVNIFINNLSKKEYEQLLDRMIKNLEDNDGLFEFFIENVTILMDKIMVEIEEDGEKTW